MPSFSKSLENCIHTSLGIANDHKHELTTFEHLLLALIDEPDAAKVMKACNVDLEILRKKVSEFIKKELGNLISQVEGTESVPTTGFQRVIQRAAIHVQSSGRNEVTGANVLVAIFAERESHAAFFLQEQEMTRYDAVNFIAHGVAKNPNFAEDRKISGSNEELDELNQIAVKQLKNRYNDPTVNKRFVIGIDRAKMRLSDVEMSQQNIVDANQIEDSFAEPVFDKTSLGKFLGDFKV